MSCKQKLRVSRRRHARIHLPALEPDQAVILVQVLERAVGAIWRAHGDEMADFLGRVAPNSMPRPYDAIWSGTDRCRSNGDDPLDF